MRHRAASKVIIVCACLAAGLAIFSSRPARASTSAPAVRIAGHVLPALDRAQRLTAGAASGRGSSPDWLTLTVVLRRDDQAGFERYLHAVYTPADPSYRRFLTQQEIADRFGPSRTAYDGVRDYLRDNQLAVVRESANRLTITARGTRAAAERAFGVHIDEYSVGDRIFFANDTDPALPADVAAHVQAVLGLSSLAQPSVGVGSLKTEIDNKKKCVTDNPLGFNATSEQINKNLTCSLQYLFDAVVYNLRCLDLAAVTFTLNQFFAPCSTLDANPYGNGFTAGAAPAADGRGHALASDVTHIDGAGQKIGLVEFDSFQTGDVADFLTLMGVPERIGKLSEVKLSGGAMIGPDESEVLLDIDTLLLLAPGANLVVYSAPFSGPGNFSNEGSFQAVFNAMIDDGVSVISNSWAYCEDQTTLADVQSIDAILQNAAASGITVLSGSGDTGSTCLDGAPNTAAVPASSPHITAVGGTSVDAGPVYTYATETWWSGGEDTPPTGEGGFGVSKFFARPDYQDALTSSANRSVPDVVLGADPSTNGIPICQADAGGCPSGLLFGGTSKAAPVWAAFTALLNQAQGADLGFLNPRLYPLADTSAFHSAADLGSDFAHVGLGSPNIGNLNLALAGASAGPVSAALSGMATAPSDPPADGASQLAVAVQLRDAHGATVAGKTVTLAANAGSHAVIQPASGVSNEDNGAVVFAVTDLTSETVTFTATDTTDGVVLQQTPSVTFVVAGAAGAGIGAFPSTVAADGTHATTITVTLKDALNRPTPGKAVTLSQGAGHSIIESPLPSVTDANGLAQFIATNRVNEVVTYTAVDVTDGELDVPGGAEVTFNDGGGTACDNVTPPTATEGYALTPFATGFVAAPLSYGSVNFGGCASVIGPAFRGSDTYFVDFFNGDVFRLGAGGGIASDANKIGTVGPTLGWPAVGQDDRLYATRVATVGDFTTGAVLELDPDTGAVVREVSSNLKCPSGLAVDPLSGDLFVDDECTGSGSNDVNIYRVRDPGGATPTTEVYAALPTSPNGIVTFAPNGTLYVVSGYLNPNAHVYRVSGTDKPAPPTVEAVPGVVSNFWVTVAEVDQDGEAVSLITLSPAGDLLLTNIAGETPAQTVLAHNAPGGYFGPDGCLYPLLTGASYRLTDADGNCGFTSKTTSLLLGPVTVTPNPSQGASQTFTATLEGLAAPEGIPVFFQVAGANPQVQMVPTDVDGDAELSYTAASEGKDVIVARASVGGDEVTSNKARVTWGAGKHVTFLTLNASVKAGVAGTPVDVTASLTDTSLAPRAAVAGATIDFALDGVPCSGVTDENGLASCSLTPPAAGAKTLIATFAETGALTATSSAVGFDVASGAPSACADANDDGSITARDALIVLRTAVGNGFCLLCICDADGSGTITASDALRVLRLAVGSQVTLQCPDCD